MPTSLRSPRHKRLAEIVAEQRRKSDLTQTQLAAKLGKHQPFVVNVENGERRIDVIEFLQLAAAIGFDPRSVIQELQEIPETVKARPRRAGRKRK